MTTQTIFNLIYIIGGVVLLAALVPVILKRFRRSKTSKPAESQPEPAAAPSNDAAAQSGPSNPNWRSRLFDDKDDSNNDGRRKLDP